VFAKPTISEGTYVWARPLDVLLWDEAALQAIEKRHEVEAEQLYVGSFNPRLTEALLAATRKSPGADTGLRRAWDYVSSAFWYSANPARTKRLPAYFEAVTTASGISELARDAFIVEGLIALLVSALTAAGQLGRVSPERARVWITDAFASGVANAAALRNIAARADDYYRDAFAKAGRTGGAASRPINIPRLVDHIAHPPEWL
jgi:hypothetical protein